MPLLINLRHLETKNVLLKGELPSAELDLEGMDELIHPSGPLEYDIEIERMEQNLLAQGTLRLPLQCECVRCLKAFSSVISLSPWACHLPLEGEDAAERDGDFVDLTAPVREDILLAFPRHPLCKAACKGLTQKAASRMKKAGKPGKNDTASPWIKLDQLKL